MANGGSSDRSARPQEGSALSSGLVEWAIYVVLTALVAAAALAPLALPYLLLALGLLAAVNDALVGRLWIPKGLLGPVPVAAYGLCLLALAGAGWSLMPEQAYGMAVLYFLLTLAAVGIPSWFALLPLVDKIKVLRPVAVGGLIGLSVLAVDISTSGGLTVGLLQTAPSLVEQGQRTLQYGEDGIQGVASFYFNRNAAALLLLLPGTMLALQLCPPFAAWRPLQLGALAVTAAVILLAESETAKLGLLAAALAYGLARHWPRAVKIGLIALLGLAVILAVPLARLPYAAGLHQSTWLPLSFRDRAVIWDYTAESVASAPWLGIGARSNGALHARYKQTLAKPSDQVLQRRPGHHPHNGFLEIWSELGALGALLTTALAVALVAGIDRMPVAVRPSGYGLVAAASAVLASGWSIWQPWLVAAIVTAMVTLQLASRTIIHQRSI